MRSGIVLALAVACLAGVTLPSEAQTLRVNPRIGVYLPVTDLGEVDGQTVEVDNSLALGLGLELALPFLPFNVRANLDYAGEASVSREGLDPDAGRTTVLAVVADAVFRFPRAVLLEPYLFAGGGLKQYDFDIDTADADAFRDASDPTLHLGGGFDVGLGGFRLNAELGDYISWYQLRDQGSKIQHDLFLTVGFSVWMF